jgi:hypothetical protein
MRARYIGQDAETITFEKTFHQWKWVNVDALGDYPRERLAQNPQFETDVGAATDPTPASPTHTVDPVV